MPNFSKAVRIQRRNWNYPANWKSLSKEVRTKAGDTCKRCGCKGTPSNPIETDHIIPLAKGGNNSKMNLRSYCHHCNNQRKFRIAKFR